MSAFDYNLGFPSLVTQNPRAVVLWELAALDIFYILPVHRMLATRGGSVAGSKNRHIPKTCRFFDHF